MYLDIGKWGADRAQSHLIVALHARHPALRLAIDLLEIDPKGAEKDKHLRAQGSTTGVRGTNMPEPEVITQRAKHAKLSHGVHDVLPHRERLVLHPAPGHFIAIRHAQVIQQALEKRGVLHLHLH